MSEFEPTDNLAPDYEDVFNQDVNAVAAQISEEKGCVYEVVTPGMDELQIDIDSEDSLRIYEQGMTVLGKYGVDFQEIKRVPSKDPGHWHIYLQAPFAVSTIERIAVQAILGSDLKRELYSYLRTVKDSPQPVTCFFERAEKQ